MKNVVHNATKESPHVWDVEVTDTFAGEANYSWVRRKEVVFDSPYSEITLRRKVRDVMGFAGVRCDVEDMGDSLQYKPKKFCIVGFATFRV